MRAAIWPGLNEPMRIDLIPLPEAGAGEVRIKVAACGVCHSDLHVLRGEVRFPAPAVLGHEVSGVIDQIGLNVFGYEVGDRVVGSFILPCGDCWQCDAGRDDLCETFFAENRLKGNLLDGTTRLTDSKGHRLSMYSMAGLAEYAVIPATAITEVPAQIPLAEAAVLGCAGLTAYGAIRAAERIGPGISVAVVAVGGIGSSLIQIASHLGASPIIAIDIDDAKLASALALGADIGIDGRDVQLSQRVLDATGGRGVQVAFEALGRPETFHQALSLLAPGGRLVAVGIADRDTAANIPITPLVRRGVSIVGSFGGSPRNELPAVVQLATEGGYDVRSVVTARYTLDHVQQAYDDLAARRITGRAIVVMDD